MPYLLVASQKTHLQKEMIADSLAASNVVMRFFHTKSSFFVLTFLACFPFFVLSVIPTSLLLPLTGEDGVVEWLGAFAWGAACLVFFLTLRAARTNDRPARFRSLILLALSVVCFLAAGEEISWGQRLFGFDTPEVVSNSNLQGEMNLHNLTIFDDRSAVDGTEKQGLASLFTFGRLGKLIWMGFLVALPLSVAFIGPIRQLSQKLQIPVPSLSIAIACFSCYICSRILFNNAEAFSGEPVILKISVDEVKETIIGIFFFCSSLAIYWQARLAQKPLP